MYCSRLLMLDDILEKDDIKKLQNYLSSLNPNLKKLITVSKVKNALGITEKLATEILIKCNQNGIMNITYAIRCPECGVLIRRIDEIDLPDDTPFYCYSCEDNRQINKEDIIVLFSLEIDISPFDAGQLDKGEDRSAELIPVAPCDTLAAIAAVTEFCNVATKSIKQNMDKQEEDSIKNKKIKENDYKLKSIEEDIYKNSVFRKENNRKIIVRIYLVIFIIYLFTIYKVFKIIDDAQISCVLTVTASVFAYISDKIINGVFSTDLEYIKIKEGKKYEVAYTRLKDEKKYIELGIL